MLEQQRQTGCGPRLSSLPMRGTASEVVGIMAETRFMNTVSERSTVTSAKRERERERERLVFILVGESARAADGDY